MTCFILIGLAPLGTPCGGSKIGSSKHLKRRGTQFRFGWSNSSADVSVLDWFGEEVPQGNYMVMMRELEELSGKELDIIFITDMIGHHEGALDMGNQALEFSERQEIITLSNNILSTQAEEIELMKRILVEN